jgi:taurine dioxygenase
MLDTSELAPGLTFGSMVRGLTLDRLNDETVRQELRDLWYARGVIVFRDCEATTEFHVELSKVFGPLVRHFNEERIVAEQPELVHFSTDADRDMVAEINGEVRVGCLPWHGDARWLAEPNHGGILRVFIRPKEGGETGFIDLIAAYDRLPDALKAKIEHLETVVRFDAKADEIYRFQPGKVRMISSGQSANSLGKRPDFPPIVQPLVYVQPETGRKVLGFTPLPLQEVIGMERDESDALLHELARHTVDECFAYLHRWEEGDMVLWDNLRVLHKACGVPPGERREGWRTTIAAPKHKISRPLNEAEGFAWTDPAAA